MTGIKHCSLGEVGPVRMCKRIMKDETSEQGDIPFFKIGTFGGVADVFISRDKYEEYKAKYPYPRKGDVLISAAGTIGRLVVFDGTESYFQDCNIVWVENDERTVLNSYLYYALKLARWKPSQGSTILRLYNDDIRAVSFYAHESKDAQRAVANLLAALDRKIALNRRKIATLEKMAKEIYDYWFVQYDFPDANGRPYKSSGGEMVYSPELKREIPKGWKVGVARDLISEIRTGVNPRDNFKFGGTIKYLTVKNLTTSGAIDFKGCDTIDDSAQMIVHKRSDIRKDDILFASIEPLGRCALLQSDPEDFDINESIFSIRYQPSTCQPEFLYYLLRSESFVASCSLASAGSVFKGIRINDLYNISVQLPARNVIEGFSSRVSCVLKQIYNVENSMRRLSTLRDFLLPLLMNGQVKVE